MKIRVKPPINLQMDRPEPALDPAALPLTEQAPPIPRSDQGIAEDRDAHLKSLQLEPLDTAAFAEDTADRFEDAESEKADQSDGDRPRTALPTVEQAPPPGSSPIGLFVTHGMGQQVRFSTLAMVASGLEKAIKRRGDANLQVLETSARTTQVGDLKTERLEMKIGSEEAGEATADLHIYEAYWAPITEGKVTLRDVMAFLYRGAWNGLKKGVGQPLERYMFGRQTLHAVPRSAFLGLFITALALGSLVLLNTVIAGVVLEAGYGVLNDQGAAPAATLDDSGQVGSALTRIVFWYLIATFLFGAVLLTLASSARNVYEKGAGPWWRAIAGAAWYGGFIPWVLLTLAAGLLTLGVLLQMALPERLVFTENGVWEWEWLWWPFGLWLVLALVAGTVSHLAGRVGQRALDAYEAATEAQDKEPPKIELLSNGKSLIVAVLVLSAAASTLGLVVLILAAIDVTGWLAGTDDSLMKAGWFRAGVWSLLFLISSGIRTIIVQYFGDVAAYVSSHTLDRFATIRSAIKDIARQMLNGIYHVQTQDGERYEHIGVVGHSLGSVVAYDALNGALNEDARAANDDRLKRAAAIRAGKEPPAPTAVDVRSRTKLLLTFGSPLDKTAYIFRGQNQSRSIVREALANAVQPMIQSYDARVCPWINVHARRDIIGSALDLYDNPAWKRDQIKHLAAKKSERQEQGKESRLKDILGDLEEKARQARKEEVALQAFLGEGGASPPDGALYCVHDIEDEQALVPLVAHNEHWETHAVFDVLVEALIAPVLAQTARAANVVS